MDDASKPQTALPDQSLDTPESPRQITYAIDQERQRLGRIVRQLTQVLTLIIVLTFPVGYFVVVHQNEITTADIDARRMGIELTQFITIHGDLWVFQEHRLDEIINRQERLVGEKANKESYSVHGPDGNTIIAPRRTLGWPVTAHEWPMKLGSQTLGKITLFKSHQKSFIKTAMVALFGIVVTAFLYLTVLSEPTRILDKAFDRLTDSEAELHRTLEDLALMANEAEDANKAKSAFLASVSHDLRTPLNAILGFAEVLEGQYFGPLGNPKYQEYAADIRTSGVHLLELLSDLLDLSAIEAGKRDFHREALILGDIFAECETIVGEKARDKGIDLKFEAPASLPPVNADKRAVTQILLNLLSNAIKFTGDGGAVMVAAKAAEGQTVIEVSDTGQGIAAESLPTLTDPFKTAQVSPHRSHEGWGLGLAIVNSLIELHDGRLDIQSVLGEGTTVTVRLPNA